jgi:putative ATPase
MEPLTLQLRPKSFDDIIGQEHLTNPNAAFRKSIESGNFGSFILFGPAGVGKTSIVNVIEQKYEVHKFNATTFTVKELRKVLDSKSDVIVFIDDCYRMTATQSDVLLPYLETSRVRFIGASADNPFLTLRSSLLSRCQIYTLEPLQELDIVKVLVRGVKYLRFIDDYAKTEIDRDTIVYLARIACGDARKALSLLETAYNYDPNITLANAKKIAPSKYFVLAEQDHFDLASAFQGSIQASDPDAAIYWLAKWLESGEDPRYIARRLMVSACEDAAGDPICAAVAHAAYIAAKEIGRPECDIPLAHATILVATAPRNKSAACAIWSAVADIRNGIIIEVPKSMKDSHYPGSAKLGHGAYCDGMNQSAYVGINNRKYYKPEDWK